MKSHQDSSLNNSVGGITFVLTLLVRASDDLEEHHNDPNRIEYFLPNLFAFDGLSYAPEIKILHPVMSR